MGKEILYLVEGVWDAIRVINSGYKCISVMTATPKFIRQLLETLPCKTIALCDGDEAGRELANICDAKIILPEGKDPNDMTTKEIKRLLQ